MKLNKTNITLLAAIISGILFFFFVLFKAYNSSFTHDESYSHLHYMDQSFMKIISFSDWYTNNHILNSLLMKYSEKMFGNSELALRLPNILLLIAYMIYSFRFFRSKGHILSISMFLLLCTNILLMDLFGLARGYGLSCGFMLICLFHFVKYVNQKKKIDLYVFHFTALLAILSNFTILTVYVSLLLTYNIVSYIQSTINNEAKFNIFKVNKAHLIPLLIIGIILYEPIRRVLLHSELNFGGKNGFFSDTVSHLISNTIHNVSLHPYLMLSLKILFTLFIIIPSVIIVIKFVQKRKNFFLQHLGLVVLNILILTITLVIVMQHMIFKSDYPIGRFSMFLFPLYIIHLGFVLYFLSETKKFKFFLILVSFLALVSTVSFIKKSNLYSCAEWGYDAETKKMISILVNNVNKHQTNKVKLGNNWIFEPTINYYRKKNKIDWLIEADREGIKETDDYWYIFKDEITKLDKLNYKIIAEFKISETLLIKNNNN